MWGWVQCAHHVLDRQPAAVTLLLFGTFGTYLAAPACQWRRRSPATRSNWNHLPGPAGAAPAGGGGGQERGGQLLAQGHRDARVVARAW